MSASWPSSSALFSATSMRRPVFVKYTFPDLSFEPLFGADQREAGDSSLHPRPLGPLSLIPGIPPEQEKFVKGGAFCRRSEPLTNFSCDLESSSRERGPGVSGGLPPGGV